jgi:hypothetical protein
MTFHPDSNLPGCMMPDGGECCAGYQALLADWRRLRTQAAEVQDTYLVGGPDLKAMSGSVESDRVIQLHFSRKATDADRAWLLEAINAKKAADKAGVGDVAQPTWQPFETAPKDGTPILCFHPDDVFQPITGIDLIWWEISENFWTQDGDSPIPFVAKPTHWRPLPTPPVSSTEGNTP